MSANLESAAATSSPNSSTESNRKILLVAMTLGRPGEDLLDSRRYANLSYIVEHHPGAAGTFKVQATDTLQGDHPSHTDIYRPEQTSVVQKPALECVVN